MKVQKRTRNGKVRWVGRYYGADGRELSKTFDTKAEATAWVGERLRELRRGEWIDPRDQQVTVGQLWQAWEKAAESDGTRKIRELIGRNLGRLEDAPIGAVKASDIRAWKTALETGRPWKPGCKGVAENTVSNWSGQLAGFFNMVVSDGLLLKSPAAGVGKRSAKRDTAHAVTRGELVSAADIWRLADAARQGGKSGDGHAPAHPTFARMIVVGAATGLRAGEIAGLRIRSVDFLRREASIVEQSKSGTSTFTWSRLKTPAARRVIPLPAIAIEALAEELRDNPSDDRAMPLFRTAQGRMWSSATVGGALKTIRERVGVSDEVTWHSLRHFYASALIHAGASVKTVQERLGHESAETTLGVYAHLWPGEDERTRVAVDEALVRDQCGTDTPEADAK
ncbi:tyrosine-type recombinase/integrase [Rhodococcus sp. NPDC003318]|uniref:tyrosine-type recombinase/integrase n=1 Tax=Rhodococcus sp. NPDC003318 TaxID=3364503 RepID=UPI0036C050D8